jgi:hypothetical protein
MNKKQRHIKQKRKNKVRPFNPLAVDPLIIGLFQIAGAIFSNVKDTAKKDEPQTEDADFTIIEPKKLDNGSKA